jgi:ADP-heptose:LPS heptosyltransferase/SAM-dependent methyltransferase
MKKRALIIRYGAYGDIIHCSPVIRALKEDGFEVTFEYNYKARQLLAYHPYINHHRLFEPSLPQYKDKPLEWLYERWEKISKGFDKVVNLYRTLEYGMIAMEDMPEWNWNKEERHKKFNKNFYDHQLAVAGYSHITGRVGEIFYPEHEHNFIKNYLKQFEDNFVVLYNFSGTGLHKVYPFPQTLLTEFLTTHPKAVVITTGDKDCQKLEFYHPRVINKAGRIPFRQALLLAKYVDCAVGCETGLMCGVGMWGTSKVHLLTAASKENLTKYDKNDYSLESPAECAPCHKGPYGYKGCPKDEKLGLPICVFHKKELILEQMEKIYQEWLKNKPQDYVGGSGEIIVNIFQKRPCFLCGKKREAKVNVNNEYNYYYCDKCGIAFTEWNNIRMDVYDEFYYKKYQGEISRKAYNYTYDNIMPKILVHLNGSKYLRQFLDLGCISEVILNRAKDDGFLTFGLDVNKHIHFTPNKHIFLQGNFEDMTIKSKFLVIWASHIFEHFKEPLRALEKAGDLLYPGGLIFISMPDITFVDWDKPHQFPHWTPNEHHIMWKREAFNRAAEKRGFEVVYSANNQDKNFICWGDFHTILKKNG